VFEGTDIMSANWVIGLGAVMVSFLGWLRYRGLEYMILHYRWVFVCLFLLPLSVSYDMCMYVRTWLIFKMDSAPKMHHVKVKHVQDQVMQVSTHVAFIFSKLYFHTFSGIISLGVGLLQGNSSKKTLRI